MASGYSSGAGGLITDDAAMAAWIETSGDTPAEREHTRDEDCTLDSDEFCVECGVSHAETCTDCGGRGFHRDGCPELAPATPATYVAVNDLRCCAEIATVLERGLRARVSMRPAQRHGWYVAIVEAPVSEVERVVGAELLAGALVLSDFVAALPPEARAA